MRLYNTQDEQAKPSVVMLLYGEGGVGKTTFSATSPKPLIIDFENGAKYFGLRGINVDVLMADSWHDIKSPEFMKLIASNKYETFVVDPVGEAMEKLKTNLIATGGAKFVQHSTGDLTMAGWGELKNRMRNFIKVMRDSGKHLIIVAHLEEKEDEGRIIKRPMVQTKLSEELVNLVDIVGYMTTIPGGGAEDDDKRVILIDPTSDKYVAKDRTGMLGKVIEPDFAKIIAAVQGTATFKWSKPAKTIKTPTKTTKDAPEATVEPNTAIVDGGDTAEKAAVLNAKLNKAMGPPPEQSILEDKTEVGQAVNTGIAGAIKVAGEELDAMAETVVAELAPTAPVTPEEVAALLGKEEDNGSNQQAEG